MPSIETYDELMDSCFGGIAGMVQSKVYKASVELYYLFVNTENNLGDWKSQSIRSASSVGANLCEGYGRGTAGMKAQFYKIARGSAYECVHWANLGEGQREPLLKKALEVAALVDAELMSAARAAQDIL